MGHRRRVHGHGGPEARASALADARSPLARAAAAAAQTPEDGWPDLLADAWATERARRGIGIEARGRIVVGTTSWDATRVRLDVGIDDDAALGLPSGSVLTVARSSLPDVASTAQLCLHVRWEGAFDVLSSESPATMPGRIDVLALATLEP